MRKMLVLFTDQAIALRLYYEDYLLAAFSHTLILGIR
jgi:hypothetical protein